MMRNTLSVLVAVAAASSIASAAPRETCVPGAIGVPTRPGGPDWTTPAADGGDNTLNDPRWNTASALSFVKGGAGEMLHARQLWAQEGTSTFLYLSFVSDLTSTPAAARDVFLALHRPLVDTKGTPADASDDEHGYILQLHLGDAGTSDTAVSLAYCGSYASCPATTDWYRVFRDSGATNNTCTNTGGAYGEQYLAWNGASATAAPSDLSWIAATNIAVWKDPGTAPSLQDKNRWGVQLKLLVSPSKPWQAGHAYNVGDVVENPTATAPTSSTTYTCATAGTSATGTAGPQGAGNVTDGSVTWKQVSAITLGLPPNAPWSFEATEAVSASPHLSFAKFPEFVPSGTSGVKTSVCIKEGLVDFLVHTELGDANPTALHPCTTCSVASFAGFQTYPAFTPPPAGCDVGLDIEMGDIGAIRGATAPDDSTAPLNEFGPGHNWLVARVHNTWTATIDQPLSATFRLADWGSTGLDNPGTFTAIPGTEDGVCAVGAETACAGTFPILAGSQRSIKYDWQPTPTDLCSYIWADPLATNCQDCNGTAGTHDSADATHCVTKHYHHECMYVELKSPGGGVSFVHGSAYNNMEFSRLSETAQTAVLDARALPKTPDQAFQDIWFIVQPRNLPGTLPAGATTMGVERTAALEAAGRIAQPYVQDLGRQTEERRTQIRAKLAAGTHPMTRARLMSGAFGGDTYNGDLAHGTPNDKEAALIVEALAIMAPADAQRVANYLMLAKDQGTGDAPNAQYARDAVATLGPVDASRIVPMLDIYPFYLPFDRGDTAEPMASFTLALSHEATLSGYAWAIDGATKVSENLYHVRIPVGFGREIRVRAQAIVPPDAAQLPGNPRWPCAGCCGKNCGLVGGLSSGTPGLLAGLWAFVRRRRKTATAV